MSASRRPSRALLYAYPKSFRRDYGDELLRSIVDLRLHGGFKGPRLAAWLVVDVVRTAPKMRLESLMNVSYFKPIAIVLATVAGVYGAIIGSSMIPLIIAAVVAVVVLLTRVGDRPIATDPGESAPWYWWIGGGVAFFGIGVGSAIVDGPDFTSTGFFVWLLGWIAAAVCVLLGIIVAVSQRTRRMV